MSQIPPQNIDAEKGLLAACLLSDPAEALDILAPEDFYKPAHVHIFRAIAELCNKKETIDLTTVYTQLKVNGVAEESGGGTYLSKLLDFPAASNLILYAKMIKAASIGRKLLQVSSDTVQEISGATITHSNIADLLDKAQSEIMRINFDLGNDRPASFGDLCISRIDQYEEYSKGKPFGIKTGFPTLDYLTGGFWGSKLIIIAARPRIGKTAIAMNMARHMASRGERVGVFSLEMDKEELIDRQIASLSGVSSIRPATGKKLNVEEWKKIHEAVEKIYQYPIFIDDTGGLTIQELKRRIRKMKKHDIGIVFIDQLSHIRGGQGKSTYEQNSSIVKELAVLKKELRMPICLLAQINRKADDRPNKKPAVSDLKNTGELEESADIVLIGHREFEYSKKEEDRYKAEWEIAKHRNGATTNLYMRWDAQTTTFQELSTQTITEISNKEKNSADRDTERDEKEKSVPSGFTQIKIVDGVTVRKVVNFFDIAKCPLASFHPDHFREDGTCLCFRRKKRVAQRRQGK